MIRRRPFATLQEPASEVDFPVFYMNYNLNPQQVPWTDAIGRAVKMFKGTEYTISRPRDGSEASRNAQTIGSAMRQGCSVVDSNPSSTGSQRTGARTHERSEGSVSCALGTAVGDSKDSVLNDALVSLQYPTGEGTETATEFAIDPAKFHDAFAKDLPMEQTVLMATTQRPVAEAAFSMQSL